MNIVFGNSNNSFVKGDTRSGVIVNNIIVDVYITFILISY